MELIKNNEFATNHIFLSTHPNLMGKYVRNKKTCFLQIQMGSFTVLFPPSLFNQFYLLLPNMRESYSTLLYFRDGKVTENIFCHRAGLQEKLYFS